MERLRAIFEYPSIWGLVLIMAGVVAVCGGALLWIGFATGQWELICVAVLAGVLGSLLAGGSRG